MRRTALAAVVLFLAAGCTASGGDEDPTSNAETPGLESVDAPLELTLQAPTAFEATGSDRGVLMAEDHRSYDFHLAGGSEHSRLTVTTYLLPETVDVADYDAQLAFIVAYDQSRSSSTAPDQHSPTLVHRYEGIYRAADLTPGDSIITQQNHYLFAGRHLIQITCQWELQVAEVTAGCEELLQSFTFPEAWPV